MINCINNLKANNIYWGSIGYNKQSKFIISWYHNFQGILRCKEIIRVLHLVQFPTFWYSYLSPRGNCNLMVTKQEITLMHSLHFLHMQKECNVFWIKIWYAVQQSAAYFTNNNFYSRLPFHFSGLMNI